MRQKVRVKTIAIIQARMGSSRLPGKVMMPLAGEPMLARVVNRTSRARLINDVVIATTDLPIDQGIADLCASRGWNCFRGSENDVLDRYYQAARAFGGDVVVRITSDCPLIDPDIIDRVIAAFFAQSDADYASNTLPSRTFPRGVDTEVFGFPLLEKLWKEDDNPETREHVTLFVLKHLDVFRTVGVKNDSDLSGWRWTVDTEEDFSLIKNIYDHFGNDRFSWLDAASLLKSHPEWESINAHIQQKTV